MLVRGVLLAASLRKPGELEGFIPQSWGQRPLLVAVATITPGSWAGASWEASTTVTQQGSSHRLPTPRGGEAPGGAACLPAWPPFSPALALSLLVSIPGPLLFLVDDPRRNEAFVLREPGQSPNQCENLVPAMRRRPWSFPPLPRLELNKQLLPGTEQAALMLVGVRTRHIGCFWCSQGGLAWRSPAWAALGKTPMMKLSLALDPTHQKDKSKPLRDEALEKSIAPPYTFWWAT